MEAFRCACNAACCGAPSDDDIVIAGFCCWGVPKLKPAKPVGAGAGVVGEKKLLVAEGAGAGLI